MVNNKLLKFISPYKPECYWLTPLVVTAMISFILFSTLCFASSDELRAESESATKPTSKLIGVATPEAYFVANVFAYGNDAIALAEKLKYPNINRLKTMPHPAISAQFIGDWENRRLYEVIPGNLKTTGEQIELIENFSVYLPDKMAPIGEGLKLKWQKKIHPAISPEQQAAEAIIMIEGRASLTHLLGPFGQFKVIQPKSFLAETYLKFILSADTPVVNLRNKHRVRNLYWQPQTNRLIRIDEPLYRTSFDYDTLDSWAAGLAYQEWAINDLPQVFDYSETKKIPHLGADQIHLPGENTLLSPEPDKLNIRISDNEEIIDPTWSTHAQVQTQSRANAVLRKQNENGFEELPLIRLKITSVHPDYWRFSILADTVPKQLEQTTHNKPIQNTNDPAFCTFLLSLTKPADS